MNIISTSFVFVLLVCIILLSSGCNRDSCGGDMKMIGDQFLNEEVSGRITHSDYPSTVTFVDSAGNEFEFLKVINESMIEREEAPYFGECESGLSFTPYFNSEKFELTYVSSTENDTISIEIIPRVSSVATQENALMPNDETQRGRDKFSVKLSFQDCPIVNTFQFLEDSRGMSVINSVPFPRRKFQQSYSDTYGLRQGWSNEVWFSYSRGIVAFNFCGKDYAQVVN
jgi:hypothetical protein